MTQQGGLAFSASGQIEQEDTTKKPRIYVPEAKKTEDLGEVISAEEFLRARRQAQMEKEFEDAGDGRPLWEQLKDIEQRKIEEIKDANRNMGLKPLDEEEAQFLFEKEQEKRDVERKIRETDRDELKAFRERVSNLSEQKGQLVIPKKEKKDDFEQASLLAKMVKVVPADKAEKKKRKSKDKEKAGKTEKNGQASNSTAAASATKEEESQPKRQKTEQKPANPLGLLASYGSDEEDN